MRAQPSTGAARAEMTFERWLELTRQWETGLRRYGEPLPADHWRPRRAGDAVPSSAASSS